MNNTIRNIIGKCSNLLNEIKEYILSNDKWLYYFIANNAVFDLLVEHPDDWSPYVELRVESFSSTSVYVEIMILDESKEVDKDLFRYLSFPGFEEQTLRLYNEYHNDALTKAIKDKRHELEYYKSQASQVEKELAKLEDKKSKHE